MYTVGVGENRPRKLRERETNSPRCVSLQFDDLIGALHDASVDLLPVLRVVILADFRVEVVETNSRYVHTGPHRHCGCMFDNILYIFIVYMYKVDNYSIDSIIRSIERDCLMGSPHVSAKIHYMQLMLTTAVAMFSDNVSVARCRSDTKFLREQVSESCRVEVRARSDDTVLGQTANLPRYVR